MRFRLSPYLTLGRGALKGPLLRFPRPAKRSYNLCYYYLYLKETPHDADRRNAHMMFVNITSIKRNLLKGDTSPGPDGVPLKY